MGETNVITMAANSNMPPDARVILNKEVTWYLIGRPKVNRAIERG